MSEKKEYIERGALPKPRYIDIDAFLASENVNNVYGDYWELKEKLDEIPAADVEPVVLSHWELHGNDDDLGSSWFCRKCGWNIDEESDANKWNRCPRCGAHMSGAK